MELYLTRLLDDGEATLGLLTLPNDTCFTLEDQHQDVKVAGETRIDAGRYEIIKRTHGRFYEAYKARWGHAWALELADVPGFTDILIHTGNKERDTEGCILVGYGANVRDEAEINQSRPAYVMVFEVIYRAFSQGERVWVTITDEGTSYV